MPILDELLRTLHRRGWWIRAWYPLTSEPVFECRITDGERQEWALHADSLHALHGAMAGAGLMPPVVTLTEGEPWPERKA